jgi:hypothetical protein
VKSLFEPWDFKGHWWSSSLSFSQGELLRVSGDLSFEGMTNELVLFLRGESADLRSPPGSFSSIFEDSWTGNEWIHGIDLNGIPITLVNCQLGPSQYHSISHLASQTQILPRYALVGIHADENSRFCEATLDFPGLAQFLDLAFTKQNRSGSQANRFYLSIRAVHGTETMLISFWQKNHFGNWNPGSQNPGPEPVSGITIEPILPQDLEWFVEVAYSLQYFLTVLYGVPTCPSRFVLGKNTNVLYRFERSRIQQRPVWTEMIIRCLGDQDFKDAVKMWFSYNEPYHEATYRFFDAFFFPHKKANVDLVLYSQTLEILHEQLSPSKNRLGVAQVVALKALKQWIKRAFKGDKSFVKEIMGRLAYTGYPSQKDRLIELFSELEAFMPALFYKNPHDFVEAVICTRNYYIHGTKKKVFLDIIQQAVAVRGLELAIVLLLLKNLGFSSNLVNHGLVKTNLWKRWALNKGTYLPY